MKHRKTKLSAAELKERRRREAERRHVFEEEGLTEDEIRFMSKGARKMLLEKYGIK